MVNTIKLKLTGLQQNILRLLFIKSGKSLNQRGIAKILSVSPPAIMKAIPNLEKNNYIRIKQDKESKRWSIELNRDNYKIRIAGARSKAQLDEIFNFMKVLIFLYSETYL